MKFDVRKLPALAKQQIEHAQLPALYLAARKTLRELSRIDEIREISDKHSAIAHYAKQAKDKTLMFYAQRVKMRALERIGELLADLPRNKRGKVAVANGVPLNVAHGAADAMQAPQKVRDALIERSPPAGIRELAAAGKRHIDADAAWANRRNYYRREEQINHTAAGNAERFADYLKATASDFRSFLDDGHGRKVFSFRDIAAAVHHDELDLYRPHLTAILEALDEFEQHLPKEKA